MPKREEQLARLLVAEGPPQNNLTCQDCRERQGCWRCLECFGRRIQCNECCRKSHIYLPLHRVEAWKGTHFEPAWLWQDGVVLHLGHNGSPCPSNQNSTHGITIDMDSDSDSDSESESDSDLEWDTESEGEEEDSFLGEPSIPVPRAPKHNAAPSAYPETADPRKLNLKYPVLVVVDISGIHEIPVQYCTCHSHPVSNDNQLFDCGLFPATFKRVQTAFTFRVLDDFRLDNLESKTSAYHYYKKLRRVTCPAFPASVKVNCTSQYLVRISQIQLEPLSRIYESFPSMEKSKAP